jgi:hypothetical protein
VQTDRYHDAGLIFLVTVPPAADADASLPSLRGVSGYRHRRARPLVSWTTTVWAHASQRIKQPGCHPGIACAGSAGHRTDGRLSDDRVKGDSRAVRQHDG